MTELSSVNRMENTPVDTNQQGTNKPPQGATFVPYGQTSSTIWGPVQLIEQNRRNILEVSLHTLPKPLQREFRHVFPRESISIREDDPRAEFLAIPSNQRANDDLVAVGDHIEQEKDRLLNVFMHFARTFCQRVIDAGYWADFIDPCSGLPMITLNCNKVYSEVDGMECLLGFKAYSAGFCKILTHPVWGSAVYPATIFLHAPRDCIIRLLEEEYAACQGRHG